MSINNLNTYLNVRDAHLRVVSGNVYAQAMNIGGINVETAHGLQSVSDTGNVTSNTLQFSNATTGFVTTANVDIGRDLVVTGNATVSTDLTVSANATVTDTLTVSEHLLASKEATVTGNLHVTTIMSDSNVVAEYTGPHDRPLRKYPEVELDVNAMTSPGVGGYIVAHSGRYSTPFAGWTVFGEEFTTTNAEATSGAWIDGNPGSYAKETADAHNGIVGSITTAVQTAGTLKLAPNTPVGAWISLELPTSIKLQRIEMRARLQHLSETNLNEVALQSFPREFGIWGYDGSNWVLLKSVTGHSANSGLGYTPTHVNATTAYNKYAIVVTRTNAVGGSNSDDRNFTSIGQLYFYGHEEGSASLDTTLKSVYNVPATTGTQLEVYYDGRETSSYTGSGTTVYDISPNTNNGTLNSGVGFDPTYKAFTFDGVDDSISATSIGNSVGDWTHSSSFWFKFDVVETVHFYSIGPNTVSGQNVTALYYNTSGYLQTSVSGGVYTRCENVFLLPDNWYHITTVKRTNAQDSIYLNGNELPVTVYGNTGLQMSLPANTSLNIGTRPDQSSLAFFDGSIANFRLYSKALNADQVKELYEYQKDYFLGSKSQVTLYKGHLGVGVTEPSGQLELAGDERIQEYPPGPMDDYETLIPGHGVFCVSASTDFGQTPYRSWNAFDKTITTDGGNNGWASKGGTWLNDGTTTPVSSLAANFDGTECHWLALQLPYEVKPTLVTLRARNDQSVPGEVPTKGRIYGSKDGVTWDQIRSYNIRTEVGTLQASTDNAPIPIRLTTNDYYTHLLLTVDERYGGSGSAPVWTSIGELRYFGTPGPTTLDKGSLSLTRSLDVPRVSRYDVDTETPRPEKLVLDFDTTVNSSPTDISGQGNHMTFHGNARYSEADKAFVFDGSTGTYMSGTQNLGTGTPAHTITGWFKRTSTLTEYTWIFTIGTSAAGEMSGLLIDPQGDIVFDIFNHRIETQKRINNNEWYHFAGVFNGASSTWSVDTCDVYINGVLEPTQSTGTSPVTFSLTGNQIYFGTSTNFLRYSSCLISNFKLYNVALEPSEVRKLYNLGRTGRSMVISDTAVGIGKVPEAQLDVRGNLNVDGVIKSNGPVFSAYEYDGYSATAAGYVTLGNTFVNKGGCYDTSTGIFTAPISGTYHFIVDATIRTYAGIGNGSGGTSITLYINNVNWNPTSTGRPIIRQNIDPGTNHQHVSGSLVWNLTAGDTVRIYDHAIPSGTDINWGQGYGRFMGYLIS